MRTNQMDRAIVVWGDGSYDTQRECVMCGSPTCSIPVHTEKYKIKVVGILDQIEEQNEELELAEMGINPVEVKDELAEYIAKEDAGEDDMASDYEAN